MLNKDTLKKILNDSSLKNTEDLNSYLSGPHRNLRLNIPKISPAQIEMEEIVTQLIQSFILTPTSIQIDYNQDSFSLLNVKTFVSILVEHESQWKMILKDQNWVSVGFNADKTVITLSSSDVSLEQIENTIRTIKTRTTDIVAYNVTQIDSQFEIKLKVDGLAHTKLNYEGSIL